MKSRIGIIGYGKMGALHTSLLKQRNDCNLIGVYNGGEPISYDTSGLKVFKSLHELFQETDAVIIASPPTWHFDHLLAAVQAGKHVLVEKPLILNQLELGRIKRAINFGQVVNVAYVERFNPVIDQLAEIVKQNNANSVRMKLIRISRERTNHGVSSLVDLGCHDIDIALYSIRLLHGNKRVKINHAVTFNSRNYSLSQVKCCKRHTFLLECGFAPVKTPVRTIRFKSDEFEYIADLQGKTIAHDGKIKSFEGNALEQMHGAFLAGISGSLTDTRLSSIEESHTSSKLITKAEEHTVKPVAV